LFFTTKDAKDISFEKSVIQKFIKAKFYFKILLVFCILNIKKLRFKEFDA